LIQRLDNHHEVLVDHALKVGIEEDDSEGLLGCSLDLCVVVVDQCAEAVDNLDELGGLGLRNYLLVRANKFS
jgi:hypothetical protein